MSVRNVESAAATLEAAIKSLQASSGQFDAVTASLRPLINELPASATTRCMKAVIAALGACRASVVVQGLCATYLMLAATFESELLVKAGGVEASVTLLRESAASDADIALHGLSALASLSAKSPPSAARAFAANAISAIVAAIKAHPGNATAQAAGFVALGNLIPFGSTVGPVQVEMAEAGVIRTTVAALGRFQSSADTQYAGFFLLSHLAGHHPPLREQMRAAGCLEAAVAAIRAFPDADEVQHAAALTLGAVCSGSPVISAAAAAAGAPRALVAALQRPPRAEQTHAMLATALSHMACVPSVFEAAVAAGGVEAVVGVLRTWPASAEAQYRGSASLAQLVIRDPFHPCRADAVARAVAAGAPALLRAALKAFPGHAGMQESARAALDNLSSPEGQGRGKASASSGGSSARAGKTAGGSSAGASGGGSEGESSDKSCLHCGARPGQTPGCEKLQVCGGCKRARFCSKQCAEAAWKGHKAECRQKTPAAGK